MPPNILTIIRNLSHKIIPTRKRKPSNTAHELGKRGEQFAENYLRKKGYRLIAKNQRLPGGEVDLIMEAPAPSNQPTTDKPHHASAIVFVEVKTRSSDRYPGELAINRTKKHRLIQLTQRLAKINNWQNRKLRIDIFVIEWPDPASPPTKVRHHPNAVTL